MSNARDTQRLESFVGTVTKKRFAAGSKSDHMAVWLETKDRGQFVLRRLGGNPFADPELEKLVGKEIACKGKISGYTLIISDYNESRVHNG